MRNEHYKSATCVTLISVALFLAACPTTNLYTREDQTSNAVKGAAIGAAAGAAVGLITGGDSAERKKRALILAGVGTIAGSGVGYYMHFLDGVQVEGRHGSLERFRWVKSPTSDELAQLTHTIARRVGRFLEGQGRKVFTLQTLPACEPDDPLADTVGKTAGFSLHAGVAAKGWKRDKLERLCRYITRPAVSEKRLSLTAHGEVRYGLKTPYRDGTTHVIFKPLDFIASIQPRCAVTNPG